MNIEDFPLVGGAFGAAPLCVKWCNLMCALIFAVPYSMISHSWGQFEYLEKSIGTVVHYFFRLLQFLMSTSISPNKWAFNRHAFS